MKRYLILIVAILVLASGIVVGCGQSQKQQDILLLDYLGKTDPLGHEYLDAMSTVMGSYPTSQDILDRMDVHNVRELAYEFQDALSYEKKVTKEALDTVNSALSFLENTSPPPEATTSHSLMIESLRTARYGFLKLSHFSSFRYEYFYSALNSSVPTEEYSPWANEELAQGLQLLDEALRTWGEATVERNNLLQPLKRYIPR